MYQSTVRRIAFITAGFLGVWLFLRYLLPVFLPFGLGLLLALSAEPAVRLGTKLRLPRWAATGIGVSLTLILLIALIGILGAAMVKELGVLAGRLPDLQTTAQQATDQIRFFLQDAASHAPAGVRPLLDHSVTGLFSSGSALMEQATIQLPKTLTAFLSRIPDGALGIGTGVISGFMLSSRLPKLKQRITEKLPDDIKTRLFPALKRSKNALLGWLKAQLKLACITFCIVLGGLLLLKIPYAPLIAAGIALVDAVPLLGTGIVLLPWALVCLLQRRHLHSIILLCVYGCAVLTRTVLEPRLVGRHLGLDPLITLIFMYLGYRFWGIGGMLLAPMLAAALTAAGQGNRELPEKE